MAPIYHAPVVQAPPVYKEMPGWTEARPMDADARGAWWTTFGDAQLNALEAQMEQASPTLAAALARYEQARATAREQASGLYPSISVGADASRERQSGRRPLANGDPETHNDFSVGATLDYELDLWGRIRNGVKAARADADASDADLASARLSLQSAVADAYFRLRGLDAQAALLNETADAYARAFQLTDKRHQGGIASGIDVNRAQTQLSNARAEISSIANERAAAEHEIAALVGAVASAFSIPTTAVPFSPPAPTGSTPSELLQRRPDVAAAERRVFAANARIGVARAAIFPSINLGLSGGYEASKGKLFDTPSSFWALGPLSAALAIFDGGARRAQVRISRAEYNEAAANYRAVVLGAFREVEDGISAISHQATQAQDQLTAAQAADRTRDLAMIRYRDGASDFLEVVIAQTAALDAERAAIALQTERMRSSVALVKALGGAP
jgi:multidrug efflux system outer membrane protein